VLSEKILNYLSENRFFEHIDRVEIKQLDKNFFELTEYNEEEYVIREDTTANEMFLIISGTVSILKKLHNGEESEISRRAKNEFVGELSLLQNGKRSAGIKCITSVKIIGIKKDTFFYLIQRFPMIKDTLTEIFIERLKESDKKTISETEKYETLLLLHQEIHTKKKELASLNQKLNTDIIIRKKVEEKLKITSERLKMLNKIIRHDLSSDFTVIISAISIFKKKKNTIMLDEIEKRAKKSLKAISDYKKYELFIESNDDLEIIEVSQLLNDVIVDYPKVDFLLEGKCKVFADDGLYSIFTNLITNSINHGNSSKIVIKILSIDRSCKIIYRDNGTGIRAEIKDKIFDEGFFFGKTGNTGIGLFIVKQMIENYGGSIKVEDNDSGGAVFIIYLRKTI